LIDHLSRQNPVAALLSPLLDASATPVVISTVVVAELVVRPARDGNGARVNEILTRLRSLPRLSIVDFDQRHAIETATVRARTGLMFPDAAIVATARLA
jgi:predicted nucleic acid-binding protein